MDSHSEEERRYAIVYCSQRRNRIFQVMERPHYVSALLEYGPEVPLLRMVL